MDLGLLVDRKGRVTMTDYLKNIFSDFPEKIQGRVETPAAEHLLTVRGDSDRKLLDKDRSTAFHHSVAKLLFSTPCVNKDIQTAVALLTTKVRIPDGGYWQNLQQVLQYIRSTIHIPLILRVDKMKIVK